MDHKDMGRGGEQGGGPIAALTADLMFAARIRAAAPGAVAVQSLEKLRGAIGPGTRLLLVDLQSKDGLEAVRTARDMASRAEVIAFGPHVDTEALGAARAAGADRVMTRGAFVRELNALVGREGE